MEVKPGYKQTEVGVIPEEWEVKPLAAIADKIMVGIASAATHAYRLKGVPMFRNQNIKAGHLDDSDLLFIAPEYEVTFKNKRLRTGDLLTMRTGYPGVTAIVPAHHDSAQSFTTLITRPKQDEAESPYLCHFINSELGQKFFTQSQIGGAQKNVNVATLRKMAIPLPPLPEQRAIAEALSDVDGLLGGLDRLIAKKRDLKQAAMQQLLTGQTRLPGFHGEWEVKTLGDVARLYQPETIAQSAFTADGYPVFGANGVVGWYSRCNHQTPQITVSCRGNCGTVNRTNGPAWITGNAMVVNLDGTSNVDHGFVYYALCHADLTVLVSGSGIPQIVRGPLEAFEVRFPAHAEQTAIATVLSEMDGELAKLEQRREKTRALKQAMMQELLTGRTRLI